jgi:hypothetical protein
VTEDFFFESHGSYIDRRNPKVNVQNFLKFYDPIHTFTKRLTPLQQKILHLYPPQMKADPKQLLGLAEIWFADSDRNL